MPGQRQVQQFGCELVGHILPDVDSYIAFQDAPWALQ